jgi:hypothetical protein
MKRVKKKLKKYRINNRIKKSQVVKESEPEAFYFSTRKIEVRTPGLEELAEYVLKFVEYSESDSSSSSEED